MRYVIVSVVKGRAGEFNNNLRKEVFEKFKTKSSKLPAHFTIKAPFEYDGDIKELKHVLENFCSREKAAVYKIDGYEHFDDRVIYMDVKMSVEGKKVHDKLIDELAQIPYINFDRKDGKNKIFHITITSKKLSPKYNEVWNYVNQFKCDYSCKFDNICLYKWSNLTWELVEEYILQ